MNLYLIGCRGSGKSTVGPLLAGLLEWDFIDLDEMISKNAGCTIADIFANEGEKGFRSREHKALCQLRRISRNVVALGGGSLINPENQDLIKRTDKIVWLRAPAALLWSRINNDPHTMNNRPDLTSSGGLTELETLLDQREPHYLEVANHTVDTVSLTPDKIAEAIEIWYRANDTDT